MTPPRFLSSIGQLDRYRDTDRNNGFQLYPRLNALPYLAWNPRHLLELKVGLEEPPHITIAYVLQTPEEAWCEMP